MSVEKPPDRRQFDNDREDWPEPDANELRLLEEHLDHLEKEGVLVRGDGIRGSLKTVAYIPGALERFLEDRGSSR